MQALEPGDVANFLARFQTFCDAVLCEFSCQPGSETSCQLVFEAKDEYTPGGWSRVTLRLENVSSWKFAVNMNCAFYILSNGLHLLHHDGSFYMDVNELIDASDDLEDYLNSNFHFVMHALWWQATEIK